MPPRRQPATLLSLCHSSVASHLATTCRMLQVAAQESPAAQVLALARRRLRPQYLNALPGSVRAELLERASRLLAAPAPDGTAAAGSGPAPLYLLALLLAPDVRHLRVELCCYYGCSHQAALLRLLATEGSGLRSLELARSALLRLDRSLLKDALTSATGLRRLVLRNIAGDAVLQVVGACCPLLEVLDVSHSRQVTDTGIRGLLVNVELKDKQGDNENNPPPPASWTKLKLLAKLVPWLRGEGRNGKRGDQRVLLEYCERSTPLCRTLHTLDVANTAVTSGGILLALHHAPNLQSLGEYGHTGRALEVLEKARTAATNNPSDQSEQPQKIFPLVNARTSRTTPRRLELIGRCCPSLKSLVLFEPRLPAAALKLLPGNLTTLGLQAVPSDPSFVSAFCSYLKTYGATLSDLNLSFTNPQHTTHHQDDSSLLPLIDLAQVVCACPRLRSLIVDNALVEWLNENVHVQLPLLKIAHIGRLVGACIVTGLIKHAPQLKVLHLHYCPDLSAQHLSYIAKHAEGLECFYVYEARHVTSSTAVNAFLSSSKHLLRTGNLANWGLDCDGTRAVHAVVRANNLQLELHSGAHWFCSPCIRP